MFQKWHKIAQLFEIDIRNPALVLRVAGLFPTLHVFQSRYSGKHEKCLEAAAASQQNVRVASKINSLDMCSSTKPNVYCKVNFEAGKKCDTKLFLLCRTRFTLLRKNTF